MGNSGNMKHNSTQFILYISDVTKWQKKKKEEEKKNSMQGNKVWNLGIKALQFQDLEEGEGFSI